jgi:hypothetical protein
MTYLVPWCGEFHMSSDFIDSGRILFEILFEVSSSLILTWYLM